MAEPQKVDLVGVGLNATDTLIPLTTYPARGSKVEYRHASVLPGGQAHVMLESWEKTMRPGFIAMHLPARESRRNSLPFPAAPARSR